MSFRLMLLRLALASIVLSALFQAAPAWAVQPFKLTDIRVEGLQRADPGTVFAALPFRIMTRKMPVTIWITSTSSESAPKKYQKLKFFGA